MKITAHWFENNASIEAGYVEELNSERYRVLTDAEIGRTNRYRLPMVFVFLERSMELTKEWQLYLCAINYGMEPKYVAALLDSNKAFTNQNGFPGRKNYITGEDLDVPSLPKFDKVRTCGGARLEIRDGVISMMDGNVAPLLKSGYSQPQNLTQAQPGVYQFVPRTHPHLFFACVTTGNDGYAHPFPNGAYYPWYMNGMVPVTFLPHVSPVQVAWPLEKPTENAPQLVRL